MKKLTALIATLTFISAPITASAGTSNYYSPPCDDGDVMRGGTCINMKHLKAAQIGSPLGVSRSYTRRYRRGFDRSQRIEQRDSDDIRLHTNASKRRRERTQNARLVPGSQTKHWIRVTSPEDARLRRGVSVREMNRDPAVTKRTLRLRPPRIRR